MKSISSYQFAVFRISFGLYLVWHFLYLIPYGGELFSRNGAFADPSLSPTYRVFPNILLLFDFSPIGVQLFLSTLVILSLFILAGYYRRASAIVVWYGWACLINRNPLISNPALPYVGLILICLALVPPGEPLSRPTTQQRGSWKFPCSVYIAAWILLALGYTFSGLVKLQSPSWVDGSAMVHLVTNPLARPGIFRDLFLSLPPFFTSLATYFSLAGEILFLPLSVTRRTRFVAWLWLCAMHFGILSMVAFADLTLGMLMIHLFLFDPGWLPARLKKKGSIIVFFDGVCGLCNRTVTLLLDEDKSQVLKFASLQGAAAKEFISSEPESIIVVDGYKGEGQQVLRGSTAVFRALDAIGGLWRVVALLRFVPRPVRDRGYYIIATNRYRWFGKSAECRMITPEVRERFLD